ncbi:MAG: ATP-binding protein [Microthrixaceae bacterium]
MSCGGGPLVVLRNDDGTGVLPTQRQRIFERFARLEEGRTRDRGGAGLGLALARIVQRHGGHIHVEDSLGGASFVVTPPSAHWRAGELPLAEDVAAN